jgi:hypothetical protein
MDKFDANWITNHLPTVIGYWNWENEGFFANQRFCSNFDIRADVRDVAEDVAYSMFVGGSAEYDDLKNVLIYGC